MSNDIQLDINVKKKNYTPYDGFNFEESTYTFYGKDINIKLINSIRRCSTDNIPCYAFPRDLINISENTSIAFNNDYMTERLSKLPIFNTDIIDLDPKISFLHENYWKNVDYLDKYREIHENEKNIEININFHNNTDQIKSFDTNSNGFNVYVDNTKVEMYSAKYPILIIKLRPDDTFKCSMKATLGISEKDSIFSASYNSWHYYENDDKSKPINLSIRCNPIFTGDKIIIKSCEYLLYRLDIIQDQLLKLFDENFDNNQIQISIIDEDYTIGEIINYEFQSHKNILFSGVTKPDHLIKKILIKIQFDDSSKSNCKTYLTKSIDNLKKKISHIKNKI